MFTPPPSCFPWQLLQYHEALNNKCDLVHILVLVVVVVTLDMNMTLYNMTSYESTFVSCDLYTHREGSTEINLLTKYF